jgi:patatin-like phospholipase
MSERTVLKAELEAIRGERGEPSALIASASPDRADGDPVLFASDDDLRRAAQSELFGLALSGGGIRSATFNLGLIQALARFRLLSRLDYLSTVSGGGYIGGWLTAWIHRVAKESRESDEISDVERVEQDLDGYSDASETYRERKEIEFLRQHSNYLTPRLGFFGADTWSGIAIYLRNLLLNQSILISVLAAVLLVPRVLLGGFEGLAGQPSTARWAAIAAAAFAVVMGGVNLRDVTRDKKKEKEGKKDEKNAKTWSWVYRQSAATASTSACR